MEQGLQEPEQKNEESKKTLSRLEFVFDSWAIQGLDEEMELGNETCKTFLSKHLPSYLPNDTFRFLEIGCGNGWVLRQLASKYPNATFVGIDISARMTWKASNWWDKPKNVEFHCSEFLNYNIDLQHQFDIVFSYASLYYIVPMERIKEKIHQWLRQGGHFIAGTDFWLENKSCHGWPIMMDLEMDLRSQADWKSIFTKHIELENVEQMILRYTHQKIDDEGSLFTSGRIPNTQRTNPTLDNNNNNTSSNHQ